eukprot:CAMPEP_0196660866 /NCGR_PEP_ID=MMETSP1086-20130531/41645_1 /TAXON_ID=77921 /ORGANISM="Cyanoptyche  gloeocystis , Strain SAG4.97" /LENGTH=338 /DNA_ID=CAMNT_0041995501 /DNA_START=595 /DNA_END=1607 /DNA_ORIENTATION=-
MPEVKSVPLDNFCYANVIRAYFLEGEEEAAVEVFRSMPKNPDSTVFNVLINYFVKQGKMDKATSFFQQMESQNVRPDCWTFSTLMDGHVRANDIEGAKKILDDMRNAKVLPSVETFNILLKGYRQRKAHKDALALLESMELVVSPDAISFNSVIDACVAAGDMDAALKSVERMQSRRLSPDVVTFSVLIKGFGRSRQLDRAFATYEEMLAADVVPDKITLYTLLHACIHCLDFVRGYKMLQVIRSSHHPVPRDTHIRLLEVAVWKDSQQAALQMLDDIVKTDPYIDISALDRVIDECASRGGFLLAPPKAESPPEAAAEQPADSASASDQGQEVLREW